LNIEVCENLSIVPIFEIKNFQLTLSIVPPEAVGTTTGEGKYNCGDSLCISVTPALASVGEWKFLG
jgi:hypothetical protein